MKYDVFISYSRRDKKKVKEFCKAFSNAGITFWIDENGIENGENFKSIIVRAIEDSSVFLYFSSKDSNASSWTAKEVGIAVSRKKNIIPIKLDDAPYNVAIEFDLVNLNVLDCTNAGHLQQSIERLLHSIQSKCQHIESTGEMIGMRNKPTRKLRLGLVISTCLLCIGVICLYSHLSKSQKECVEDSYAIVDEGDRLLKDELLKCYYNDEGVRCFDSISSSRLILVSKLYDSAFSLNPSADFRLIVDRRENLQKVIDSVYCYFVNKYQLCVETQREYTAKFCKDRYIELENYVTENVKE